MAAFTCMYITVVFSFALGFVPPSTINGSDTCESLDVLNSNNYYSKDIYPSQFWSILRYPDSWYNTSFWGGYELIAWKDNIASYCWKNYTTNRFLVLSEKHPDISDLTEDVQSLQGCIVNQSGDCVQNITVDIKKCHDDVLYRFIRLKLDVYICFDRIYEDKCGLSTLSLPANEVNKSTNLVNLKWSEIKLGWYDSSFGGQNYTIPVIEDTSSVAGRCYDRHGFGLYRLVTEPLDFGEMPTGFRVCQFSEYEYEQYFDKKMYSSYCNYHVFVRSCNGKLLVDLSLLAFLEENICLIRTDNVKVLPEIRHRIKKIRDGDTTYNQYNPFLQFRCSFQASERILYKVKWYVNGDHLLDKGPTSNINDLVLTENELTDQTLGYEVKCSVIIYRNQSDDEVFAVESEAFYAGYKFSDTSLKISNRGYTPLSVRMTVPTGCTYNDLSPAICEEPLTLIDTSNKHNTGNGKSKREDGDQDDTCGAGVQAVNADDHSSTKQMLKTLKNEEEWTGPENFMFDMTTTDNTYEDSPYRSARVDFPPYSPGPEVEITVDLSDCNRNKLCYSHVDPHMRTADGRRYEQQRVGDYMLYKHLFDEIEVQERARKCNRGGNAVCACGVVVRSGMDAFTIDRCEKPFKTEFLQCGDCGIIDVVKESDTRYNIYTPIRTRISITLLGNVGGGRNMNIDIYLGIKDCQNTAGLCGYFDEDNSNDFRLRDESVRQGNNDYVFSENWRLTSNENLFDNPNRNLKKMRSATQTCFRQNSITKDKCNSINPSCNDERRKRGIDGKVLQMAYTIQKSSKNIRSRRETETNITIGQAEEICRNAINSTPAVLEFPDQLANEDLDNVKDQCIFDVTVTNDASWAKAHSIALNNIATNILNLKPIFKSNNSGAVETFLKHTCLNNCSSNGECSNEGLCTCRGVYRGSDCSYDVRIPPLIEEVKDGGNCDSSGATECRCFIVYTNNIFEGFKCDITTFKMTFNGRRHELGRSTGLGEYGDLHTGECCAHVERTKRNDFEPENFIHTYDLSISNDGDNFGDISSVYVYDATCLRLVGQDDKRTAELKEGYCFIDNACVVEGSTYSKENDTQCCNPQMNMYTWTDGECGSDNGTGLKKVVIYGIVAGSICLVALVTAILVYMRCFRQSKKRTVATRNESTTQI